MTPKLNENHTRQENAKNVLDLYRGPFTWGQGGDGDAEKEDVETALSDLLADLMHLAGSMDMSFLECLGRAERHYEAEITEEEAT